MPSLVSVLHPCQPIHNQRPRRPVAVCCGVGCGLARGGSPCGPGGGSWARPPARSGPVPVRSSGRPPARCARASPAPAGAPPAAAVGPRPWRFAPRPLVASPSRLRAGRGRCGPAALSGCPRSAPAAPGRRCLRCAWAPLLRLTTRPPAPWARPPPGGWRWSPTPAGGPTVPCGPCRGLRRGSPPGGSAGQLRPGGQGAAAGPSGPLGGCAAAPCRRGLGCPPVAACGPLGGRGALRTPSGYACWLPSISALAERSRASRLRRSYGPLTSRPGPMWARCQQGERRSRP